MTDTFPNSVQIKNDEIIYDVCITGGGPAGSSLAYQLSTKGFRVILIEKSKFPRYKACGGGLTMKAIRQFPFNLDPVIEIEATGAIIAYQGMVLSRTKPEKQVSSLVMRADFDQFLCDQALEQGAIILYDCSFNYYEKQRGTLIIHTDCGEIRTKYLVGADGVNSRIARQAGLLTSRQTGTAIEAEICISNGLEETLDGMAVFDFGALENGYGWIFPKRSHLSIGIFFAHPGKLPELKSLLKEYLQSNGILNGYTILHQKGHLIPLGGDDHPLNNENILLVGDAANLADPWLGEGISYALQSAGIAAEVLEQALHDPVNTGLKEYSKRIHIEINKDFRQARRIGRLVYQYPKLTSTILARSAWLQDAMVNLIRGDLSFSDLSKDLQKNAVRILTQAIRNG